VSTWESAAAAFLPSDDPAVLNQAANAAIDYAQRNGLTIGPAQVVFSTTAVQYDAVTVVGSRSVAFSLARGIGVNEGTVNGAGASQVGSLTGMREVLPWGVEEPAGGFIFGETYCLKNGSDGGGGVCSQHEQGNFGALDIDDLGNGSADDYRDRIRDGSTTMARIGQVKLAMNGNMTGPTSQGVGCTGNDGRITGNSQTFDDVVQVQGSQYTVLDWASPRLAILPIVDWLDDDDAAAQILGFGVFFIEDCAGGGAVLGQFIETVVPDGEWGPYSTAFGARAVRLVD